MLKNLEVRVTANCNSRCIICHIWKIKTFDSKIKAKQYKKLFSRPEFRQVEDLQISGGEPLVRDDIWEIIKVMLDTMPKLNKILLATNGTQPEKALALFKKISKYKKITLKLCVSLEGDRGTNKKVRGIDNYDSAIKTLELCKSAIPELKTMISMTLTKINCNLKSFKHLQKIASMTNSVLSFRAFYNSDYYHYNYNDNLEIDGKQKALVVDFTRRFFSFDEFLMAQAEYLKTGKFTMMEKCRAGKIFADIRPDGTVAPCLNSTRIIGDYKKGIYTKNIKDLGKYEKCPCCDEACFFPMLHWDNKK
jgi:MoaA/NifB/PqqE/SkfB family radical SAM enzyme